MLMLPKRNRMPKGADTVVDLGTPRGRLQMALAGFVAHLQDNPPEGAVGMMLPGVLHFLGQICRSITDTQVLDTVREVRKQLDYIEHGSYSLPGVDGIQEPGRLRIPEEPRDGEGQHGAQGSL